jgi:tripartite-type tricarboxylate transporter receptor subunit TctC
VAPEKGIRTLQELVAAAKAKPGSITFGTAGVGSATHISAEIFALRRRL